MDRLRGVVVEQRLHVKIPKPLRQALPSPMTQLNGPIVIRHINQRGKASSVSIKIITVLSCVEHVCQCNVVPTKCCLACGGCVNRVSGGSK